MIFQRGHFKSDIIEKSVVNDLMLESRNFSFSKTFTIKSTVFLSHKHYDPQDPELKDLRGIINILEQHGAKIYVDSMDNKMPNQTTGETALRIKEIIKFCKKFILFATEEAIESFWCNWELGIGDVYKYPKDIAILPMKDIGSADRTYKGNEYLQIYPRIDYRNGTTHYTSGEIITKGFYWCKPKNKDGMKYITKLEEWLSQ